MRAILTMTLNDLRIFFGKRGNWLGLLLIPILFTLGLGYALSGSVSRGPERLRVDVIDEDKSAASARLLADLQASSETLELCPQANDAEDYCQLVGAPLTLAVGEQRVRDGDSAALIVIPAGYATALATLAQAQIDYYSTAGPTAPDAVRQTLNAIMVRVNSAALTAGAIDAVLGRVGEATGASAAIDPWRATFVRDVYTKTETLLQARPPLVDYVTVGGAERNPAVSGFSQSVPGIGSMYVMFTVFGGMTLFQRERQRWTLQRLGVFPVTRGQVLGAKILTYFTLGMLQYLAVFSVGLLAGLDLGPNPWLLLPTMVFFVLCCTALTFAIAPSLHSEAQAGVTTQLLSLTFASLGGAWWPLEIVPEFMQRIGHVTPVAWAMDAFRDLLYYGGGVAAILPEWGVLLGAAAVLFGIGIWRFRYL